eukprot:TRINITY_DN10266_c0_g1_i1.p1 TRINITY_DN10266_c0_g1~~TRINITY_DN10266_c0_g1_i1.p1  ORF type:complete len:119 (-),score=22.28 TRINITY_DN10266_c0_g1_i1:141-467(-)
MNTACGIPHYIAPEVMLLCDYSKKCDLWSLGVILYLMLVGYQPFDGETSNDIYKLIAQGKYDMDSDRWNDVSVEAKDLVQFLLQIDPEKRYSAKEVIRHKWIRKYIDV